MEKFLIFLFEPSLASCFVVLIFSMMLFGFPLLLFGLSCKKEEREDEERSKQRRQIEHERRRKREEREATIQHGLEYFN